jgi:hypothetical protein
MEDKCVSYNLGPLEGAALFCELSDTDHVEYPDDVKSVPGAKYCGIKVGRSKCEENMFKIIASDSYIYHNHYV